jgi:hypothetical protein
MLTHLNSGFSGASDAPRPTSTRVAVRLRDHCRRRSSCVPHLYEQRISPIGPATAYPAGIVPGKTQPVRKSYCRSIFQAFSDGKLFNELLRFGIGALKVIRDAPADDLLGPAILHDVVVVWMARDLIRHDFGRIQPLSNLNARES